MTPRVRSIVLWGISPSAPYFVCIDNDAQQAASESKNWSMLEHAGPMSRKGNE